MKTLEEQKAIRRAYYLANKDKIKARARAWEIANRERVRERRKKYRAKDDARSAAWRKANPERMEARRRRWREQNPDKHLQAQRDWESRNPHSVAVRLENRRARKKNAAGRCSIKQAQARIALYGGMCAYCGIRPHEPLDHVIPLARGGTNWPANFRPSCKKCNRNKSDKLLSEWKGSPK